MRIEANAKIIINTFSRTLTEEEQLSAVLAVEQRINSIGQALVRGNVPAQDDILVGMRVHVKDVKVRTD